MLVLAVEEESVDAAAGGGVGRAAVRRRGAVLERVAVDVGLRLIADARGPGQGGDVFLAVTEGVVGVERRCLVAPGGGGGGGMLSSRMRSL